MLLLSKCVNIRDEPEKRVAFGVVAIVPALAAGYLAFRLATARNISSALWRLVLLFLVEAGLLAIYPGIPIVLGKLCGWS